MFFHEINQNLISNSLQKLLPYLELNAQFIHIIEALVSFDASKQTLGIQLCNDCLIARQSSEDQKWEWVVCAVPSDRFEVRVRRNPKHKNLFIGFTESDSSLVDWMETSR